ncbi:hypothetical protein HK097_006860, partial [Rhizophlyctis rosea]
MSGFRNFDTPATAFRPATNTLNSATDDDDWRNDDDYEQQGNQQQSQSSLQTNLPSASNNWREQHDTGDDWLKQRRAAATASGQSGGDLLLGVTWGLGNAHAYVFEFAFPYDLERPAYFTPQQYQQPAAQISSPQPPQPPRPSVAARTAQLGDTANRPFAKPAPPARPAAPTTATAGFAPPPKPIRH